MTILRTAAVECSSLIPSLKFKLSAIGSKLLDLLLWSNFSLNRQLKLICVGCFFYYIR